MSVNLKRKRCTVAYSFWRGCCVEEIIAVPYQESFAERKLGLLLILSTANVVKTFEQSFVGQITPSDSNCVYTLPSSSR